MSSRLITQLANEAPKILLVASENDLRSLIEGFYSRQGLEVVLLNPEKTNQNELKNILSKDFYKIVALDVSGEIGRIFPSLKKKKNLLVVQLVSSTSFNKHLLESTNLIVGLDVILKINGGWPVFKFITKKSFNKIILDPEINCYPQSQKAFFQTIKNLLISPKKKQVLIRGKKHVSGVIVDEIGRLFELLYTKKLYKKTAAIKPLNTIFSKLEIIEQKTEALPSLLEELVRGVQFLSNKKTSSLGFHEKNLKKPKSNLKKIPPHLESEIKLENLLVEERLPQAISKTYSGEPQGVNSDFEKISNSESHLDEKLSQIFQTQRVQKKSENIKQVVKATKKITKKTKKKKILFWLGLIFTTLAILMSFLASIFLITKFSLKKELMSSIGVFSSQASQEEQESILILEKLSKKANFLHNQIEFYDQFLPPDILIGAKTLAEISEEIVEQSDNLLDFEDNLEKLITSFLGKDLTQNLELTQKINQASQKNYKVISRLISRLKFIENLENDLEKQNSVGDFTALLDSQQKSLTNFQQLYPIIDSLMGLDGKKVYAVVFQNNQELRPTGGFIQAVALVVVDQGMIVDVQAFSSYELDKKLGGAVKPPDEIISLLGENKWYLRDSNWNPDFEVTGKQIAWFLEQETNKKIDGVIGINLFTIVNLLKELGPLELGEFNEVITDKNIFERAEFHSEIKLVESSETKDYSTKLLQTLLQDVMNRGQEKPFNLLRALGKSLREKEMSVYLRSKNQEDVFSLLGWAGNMIAPECPTQLSTIPCQVDSLMVVDANIGINKANYHTTRSDKHLVELEGGLAKHTRTITFDNTAFVNAWPKGVYKSYLRFYLPSSARSVVLKMDGESVVGGEFVSKKEGDWIVVGFVSETPIKTRKNIEISYEVPLEFSLPYSYVFFNQKQPGVRGILPEIVFKHNASLSPTLIAPKAEVLGTAIVFDSLDEDHAFVGVSFE